MFVGEAGSDVGGLTREFFRLIKYDMSIYIDSTGSLKHNSLALQVFTILKTILPYTFVLQRIMFI